MKNLITIADLFGANRQLAFWELRQRAHAEGLSDSAFLLAFNAAIRCGDVEVNPNTGEMQWMGENYFITPQTAAQ